MARRLVVVDASSLIGLSAIGAFHLLERLFGTVAVTREVWNEVMAGGGLPGAADLDAAVATGRVRVMDVQTDGADFPRLGAGEASTLRLAMAHAGAKLVVIDE